MCVRVFTPMCVLYIHVCIVVHITTICTGIFYRPLKTQIKNFDGSQSKTHLWINAKFKKNVSVSDTKILSPYLIRMYMYMVCFYQITKITYIFGSNHAGSRPGHRYFINIRKEDHCAGICMPCHVYE